MAGLYFRNFIDDICAFFQLYFFTIFLLRWVRVIQNQCSNTDIAPCAICEGATLS